MATELNVLGTALETFGLDPMTGFLRDGACSSGPQDIGSHTVCAEVNEIFLEYSRSVGNDLSTSLPEHGFPGLKPGDKWCVCASRWLQAYEAGCAPPSLHQSDSRTRATGHRLKYPERIRARFDLIREYDISTFVMPRHASGLDSSGAHAML